MTRQRKPPDPGKVAAFLGGELSGAEREEFLQELASSREAREVLADASALLGVGVEAPATREGSGTAAIHPPAPPPRVEVSEGKVRSPAPGTHRAPRRTPRGRAAALTRWSYVAVAAAAVVTVVLVRPEGRVGEGFAPHLAVGEVRGRGSVDQVLGAEWLEPHWSASRGSTDVTSDPARAVRLGSGTAQVLRAAAMSDPAALRSAAEPLAQMAREMPTGSIVARVILADSTGSTLRGAREAARLLAGVRRLTTAPAWFDLGVWLESARQVSSVGLMSRPEVAREALEELERLRASLDASVAGDPTEAARWSLVKSPLEEVRTQLATGRWASADQIRLDSALSAAAR